MRIAKEFVVELLKNADVEAEVDVPQEQTQDKGTASSNSEADAKLVAYKARHIAGTTYLRILGIPLIVWAFRRQRQRAWLVLVLSTIPRLSITTCARKLLSRALFTPPLRMLCTIRSGSLLLKSTLAS